MSVLDHPHLRLSEQPEGDNILERARRGDQDAIRWLFDETKSYAYFVARRYLQSDADAEDVLQEAYITAFGRLDTFDGGNFRAWLHKIVVNKCLNAVKKKKVIFVSGEELPELPDDNGEIIPSEWLERAEKRRDILNIVNALPPGQRMAVSLFYFENLPVAEIAAIMEVAVNTVTSHLVHGRNAIRKAVLMEEEKGNKLYGIVPLPLLTQLFELEAEKAMMPESVSKTVWEGTVRGLKAGGLLSEANASRAGDGGGKNKAAKVGPKTKFSSLSGGLKALILSAVVLAVIAVPVYMLVTGTPLFSVEINGGHTGGGDETGVPSGNAAATAPIEGVPGQIDPNNPDNHQQSGNTSGVPSGSEDLSTGGGPAETQAVESSWALSVSDTSEFPQDMGGVTYTVTMTLDLTVSKDSGTDMGGAYTGRAALRYNYHMAQGGISGDTSGHGQDDGVTIQIGLFNVGDFAGVGPAPPDGGFSSSGSFTFTGSADDGSGSGTIDCPYSIAVRDGAVEVYLPTLAPGCVFAGTITGTPIKG